MFVYYDFLILTCAFYTQMKCFPQLFVLDWGCHSTVLESTTELSVMGFSSSLICNYVYLCYGSPFNLLLLSTKKPSKGNKRSTKNT